MNESDVSRLIKNFDKLVSEYKEDKSVLKLGMLLGIHRTYVILFEPDENSKYMGNIIDEI